MEPGVHSQDGKTRLVFGLQKGSCWPGWAEKRGTEERRQGCETPKGDEEGDQLFRKERELSYWSQPSPVLSEKYSWMSSRRKEIHQNHHLTGEVETVKHTVLGEFTENVAIKSNAEAKVMFERETIYCDDCMSLSFRVMLNYEMQK